MLDSSIQSKLLRRSKSPQEYRVYRAGLEWDLTDPIVIEDRDDLKSEYRWRDRLEPYHHQVKNLITFCRRLPVTLLADDVGLGKTISAGLIISELLARSRLSKVLVVCPKLLGPQWCEELETKFDFPAEIATGKQLLSANPDDIGAVVTTYHSARLYLDSLPHDRFDMLVLDEAHKLRNLYGVDTPPQVAQRFREALEERRFRYVLMLTATPIHNRLWDLYSLVDLLTVARGHQNPFGSEGMFARKFIADNRTSARQLKPEGRDEFRSIVYGYMSRVRRGDAKLYFPDRVVQMHKVDPTTAEMELIQAIAKPIQKLNRLAQISILQALTSSPDALMVQLNNMARNGTVPMELAAAVQFIVSSMTTSAKLDGLAGLVDRLTSENPDRWRMVVFTGRLETQTTIQAHLEHSGLKVGIINGSSGRRNQETLARFRHDPPDYHVIVSTEAGSEGINLQVANVLVNYDLPWNPMIVEQRIGRVQRLASEHASVAVFNIMLRGTFEEYIVGRLMEKLQMASHAIGDVEALLEASGIDDDDGTATASFDERIRRLVIAALAGKDVEAATRQEVESIDKAKEELEREEAAINQMLGGMDGVEYVGPRAPDLPTTTHAMEPREFALAAYPTLGARVSSLPDDLYLVEEDGGRERVRFTEHTDAASRSTYIAPGTPAFTQLVNRIIATGQHDIRDLDEEPAKKCMDTARHWVRSFAGTLKAMDTREVQWCFTGAAVVRTRSTVAHDSYERLVEVACAPDEHHAKATSTKFGPLPHAFEDPGEIGVNLDHIAEAASRDEAISEFSRFYLERRSEEVNSAGEDERKLTKLKDDFTPRLDMTLVALDGTIYRLAKVRVQYEIDDGHIYQNDLTLEPQSERIIDAPVLERCSHSGKIAPKNCLKKCEITGTSVLAHLLAQSEVTGRSALPEHTVMCDVSGRRVLKDEAELSDVTGRPVSSAFLKTSDMSGKRAEAEHFDRCEFSHTEALKSELAASEISGKRYRVDQRVKSAVSGKTGHKQEFLT